MNFFLKVVLVLFISLVLGIGSAFLALRLPLSDVGIKNGAWRTSLTIGAPDANMYQRAYVAKVGLFALNKTETIYYSALTDDKGGPLVSDCNYRIEGGKLDTRWWSITLYGEDHFLIPNEQNRHSYSANTVKRETDGRYNVYLSQKQRDGAWLYTGEKSQNISLSLRLYNPAPIVYESPNKISLPRIIKEECK